MPLQLSEITTELQELVDASRTLREHPLFSTLMTHHGNDVEAVARDLMRLAPADVAAVAIKGVKLARAAVLGAAT